MLELLPDGSYRSVLISPKIRGKARQMLVEAARRGEDLDRVKRPGYTGTRHGGPATIKLVNLRSHRLAA